MKLSKRYISGRKLYPPILLQGRKGEAMTRRREYLKTHTVQCCPSRHYGCVRLQHSPLGKRQQVQKVAADQPCAQGMLQGFALLCSYLCPGLEIGWKGGCASQNKSWEFVSRMDLPYAKFRY